MTRDEAADILCQMSIFGRRNGKAQIAEAINMAIKVLKDDAVPVVRCKDCKYFELNSWANVGGYPLIVAHEVCKKWGNGCKTSPDGYCFMGERKDGKDDNDGID